MLWNMLLKCHIILLLFFIYIICNCLVRVTLSTIYLDRSKRIEPTRNIYIYTWTCGVEGAMKREATRSIYPPTFPTYEQCEPIVCSSILRSATKRCSVIVSRSQRDIYREQCPRNGLGLILIIIVILIILFKFSRKKIIKIILNVYLLQWHN